MVSVRLEKLTKAYGDVLALDSVSLDVDKGELFFFLGPSGCGKTTLLRAIAGLCGLDEGEVYFGDRPITLVPPHKRNIGMVFQNYALWPHMTVSQNVAFGLDVRKIPRSDKGKRVREALEMVRMSQYAARRPAQLSGGQQQRVALARALVIRPDVILLDEPLSNLDAKLRLEMRVEITRIHAETGITTLYVTHDQKEALSMAQKLAIMRDGRVEQLGGPQEVYRNPATAFVAGFIGEANFFPGKIVARLSDGCLCIETSLGRIDGARSPGAEELSPGRQVTCMIRPESFRLDDSSLLKAEVKSVTYLGEVWECDVAVNGVSLKIKQLDPTGRAPSIGDSVPLALPPQAVMAFPAEVSVPQET